MKKFLKHQIKKNGRNSYLIFRKKEKKKKYNCDFGFYDVSVEFLKIHLNELMLGSLLKTFVDYLSTKNPPIFFCRTGSFLRLVGQFILVVVIVVEQCSNPGFRSNVNSDHKKTKKTNKQKSKIQL